MQMKSPLKESDAVAPADLKEKEVWRDYYVEDSIFVKTAHKHPLVLFVSKKGEYNRERHETETRKETAEQQNGDEYDDESYEDDNTWLCDGTKMFKDGCKSGQTDFDEHPGIDGWTCPETTPDGEYACDFDLCGMCIRWCIHCEKYNLDPGLIPLKEAKYKEQVTQLSEPYLTERNEQDNDKEVAKASAAY